MGGAEVASVSAAMRAFSTGGHSVYHLRAATGEREGGRALVSTAYDGQVLCHTQEGELLWKRGAGGFPFDLAVADLDGDGLDKSLVASSDGTVYAFGRDGALFRLPRRTRAWHGQGVLDWAR